MHSARDEKQRITESYAGDGGVRKKAAGLNSSIAASEKSLAQVCRDRALAVLSSLSSENLDDKEQELYNQGLEAKQAVEADAARIAKLKAGIALDEEQAKAARLQKNVESSEAKLAELKKSLDASKARIEDLQKQL
jgi:hypothetical protein